jgi:hypothetical protein
MSAIVASRSSAEVVADGGLALFEQFAEVADIQLEGFREEVDDLQPSAIGQQLEQFDEFVCRFFRKPLAPEESPCVQNADERAV